MNQSQVIQKQTKSQDLAKLKQMMTQPMLKEKIARLMMRSKGDLEKIYFSNQTSGYTAILAGIILRAQDEACLARTQFLFDRVFGSFNEPNKDQAVNNQITFVVEMNDNGKFKSQRPKQLNDAIDI